MTAADLCRKYGISEATFGKWRSKGGGMEVSDSRRLMVLEDENRLCSAMGGMGEGQWNGGTISTILDGIWGLPIDVVDYGVEARFRFCRLPHPEED